MARTIAHRVALDAGSGCLSILVAPDWAVEFRVSSPREGLAIEVRAGAGELRPFRGDPGIPIFTRRHIYASTRDPVRVFLGDSIPSDLRHLIADGPERLNVGAVRLASLPEGAELARTSPALFFVAAQRAQRLASADEAVPWLRRKRRELLAWAIDREQVPESRVRLLAKVDPSRIVERPASRPGSSLITLAGSDALADAVRHFRRIPRIVSDLAVEHAAFVIAGHRWMLNVLLEASVAVPSTPLEELALERRCASLVALYDALVTLAPVAGSGCADALRNAADEEHLIRLARRIARRAGPAAVLGAGAVPGFPRFPSPPLEGVDNVIWPLRDTLALVAEGAAMSHCSATLADSVMKGEIYLYGVQACGERATAGVRMKRVGSKTQYELVIFGPHNIAVRAGTYDLVMRWMESRLFRPKDPPTAGAPGEPLRWTTRPG